MNGQLAESGEQEESAVHRRQSCTRAGKMGKVLRYVPATKSGLVVFFSVLCLTVSIGKFVCCRRDCVRLYFEK